MQASTIQEGTKSSSVPDMEQIPINLSDILGDVPKEVKELKGSELIKAYEGIVYRMGLSDGINIRDVAAKLKAALADINSMIDQVEKYKNLVDGYAKRLGKNSQTLGELREALKNPQSLEKLYVSYFTQCGMDDFNPEKFIAEARKYMDIKIPTVSQGQVTEVKTGSAGIGKWSDMAIDIPIENVKFTRVVKAKKSAKNSFPAYDLASIAALTGVRSKLNYWEAVERNTEKKTYLSAISYWEHYTGKDFPDNKEGNGFPAAYRRIRPTGNFRVDCLARLGAKNNFVIPREAAKQVDVILPYIKKADTIIKITCEVLVSKYRVLGAEEYVGDLDDEELFYYPPGSDGSTKFIHIDAMKKLAENADYWEPIDHDRFVEIGKSADF